MPIKTPLLPPSTANSKPVVESTTNQSPEKEWDTASKERKVPEKVKQPVQQKTLKRGYQKLPPAK